MNRRTQLLLGISTTVGTTLLLTWLAVQFLVVQPAIGDQEPLRIQQVQEAAARLRAGASTREVEDGQGIDIRLFLGPAEGPPAGDGWVRQETARGTVWKRDNRNHEIAAWNGQVWVALQSHPPHAETLALLLLAVGVPMIVLVFGFSQRASRHLEQAEARLDRIAAGDLSQRLDPQVGHREARRMAAAVNQMAERLQGLMESDRQRMAGLSHELRTPLTRIRLELELARREGHRWRAWTAWSETSKTLTPCCERCSTCRGCSWSARS